MKDIIKEIFWLCLGIMKSVLSLAEFKLGKNTDDYRYFKKEVMNYVYRGLTDFYNNLEEKKHVERCECEAKIRKGYSSCEDCGGSGFKSIK